MKKFFTFILVFGAVINISRAQNRPNVQVVPGYPAYVIGNTINCALLNDTPCMVIFTENPGYQLAEDEIVVDVNDEIKTKFVAKDNFLEEVNYEAEEVQYEFEIVRYLED